MSNKFKVGQVIRYIEETYTSEFDGVGLVQDQTYVVSGHTSYGHVKLEGFDGPGQHWWPDRFVAAEDAQ